MTLFFLPFIFIFDIIIWEDSMLRTALKLLKKIEEHGFKAYIVGGFVRDFLLSRESLDIDIATSATPMDIKQIFYVQSRIWFRYCFLS